jgi:hypothetical protein
MTTTITTTLGALVQAERGLPSICALKVSAKAAYHVAKLARLVAQETKHFHTRRDTLIQELGTKNDDGSMQIVPDTDAFAAFVAAMNDEAAVVVDIPWSPITLAMLGDQPVSAADLAALGPLFDGEGD